MKCLILLALVIVFVPEMTSSWPVSNGYRSARKMEMSLEICKFQINLSVGNYCSKQGRP